jgi:hypothetical protein
MKYFHDVYSFGLFTVCHRENAGLEKVDFLMVSHGICQISIHSHLDACIQVIYTIGRHIWKRLHGIHHYRPIGLSRRIRRAHPPPGIGGAEKNFQYAGKTMPLPPCIFRGDMLAAPGEINLAVSLL